MTGLIDRLADWILDIVHTLGYLGVALSVAIENVFPPIPSELVLPLAGFLAGQGRFSLPVVILAATVGSVAGALVLYAVGRWMGEGKVRWFVCRYGGWFLLDESDLDKSLDWFRRHGRKSVLIGRVVPLVRSLVSIPAGIARMPVLKFVIFTALGSTVWNTALIGAGWLLGEQWARVEDYTRPLSYAVLLVIVVAVAWFAWQRTKSRSRRRAEAER
jgi:membrane protein DedA with SNARE-associated domain